MTKLCLYLSIAALTVLSACGYEPDSPMSPELAGTENLTLAKKDETASAWSSKMIPHNGEIFFYPTMVEQTDDPLVVRIFYEGEGKASHFGNFSETGEYALHSDEAGVPLFISDVVATRYTASGEEVYLANVTGVISLTGDPEHPMILEGDYNYSGGTGRFEGLEGSLHWRAVGNADGSAVSHFKGAISTVCSGKND